jgi:hypothetical protein
MATRGWATVVFTGLMLVGSYGTRFLSSSQTGREGVMSLLDSLDSWLLRDAYSPTLLIIGLAGLLSIWVLLPVGRFWRQSVFGAARREFSDQFNSVEQTMSRRDFRWNIERAYRQANPDARSGQLASALETLRWPANFPPADDISRYAENVVWPDDSGRAVWKFMDELFGDVLDLKKRHERLPYPYYHSMLVGRFIAAKFWNVWALRMTNGLLSPNSITHELSANRADINALALAELAIEKALGWDHSQGKRGLFLLARDGLNVAGGNWLARVRRYLGGVFVRLGEKLRGKNVAG